MPDYREQTCVVLLIAGARRFVRIQHTKLIAKYVQAQEEQTAIWSTLLGCETRVALIHAWDSTAADAKVLRERWSDRHVRGGWYAVADSEIREWVMSLISGTAAEDQRQTSLPIT